MLFGAYIWLDLYPDIFDRFEGTDAWYLPICITWVSTTLPTRGGASGAHMLPKQAEMGGVVTLIYDAIEQKPHLQNTLFILLGDHGMTEQGSHGGASASEVASAMVFISPKFKSISHGLESPVQATGNYEYYSVINQVDFVLILASLIAFIILVESLGIFAAEFLGLFHGTNYGLQFLFMNAQQMRALLEAEYDITVANSNSCSRYCEGCPDDYSQVVCLWEKAMLAKREWESTKKKQAQKRRLNALPNNPSHLHLSMSIAGLSALMLLLCKVYSLSGMLWDTGILIFGIIIALHRPTMFLNQLVVKEHHYWYWTSLAWLGNLGFKRMANGEHWLRAVAYPVALQFFSQSLNQTTDPQHSVVEYIHNLLFHYHVLFWVPGLITYASALNTVSRYPGLGSLFSIVTSTTLYLAAVSFRLSSSYRINSELFNFAPPWLKNIMTGVDRNQSLNIFRAGLAACLVFLAPQFRFSGRISRKATLVGIVELANLYLWSLTLPEHLVLFTIFDLQLQWLPTQSEKEAVSTRYGPNGVAKENGTSYVNGKSQRDANGHAGNIGNIMDSRTDEETINDNANKTGSLAHGGRSFFQHLTLQTFYTASTSLAVMLACIWPRNDPTIWTVLAPKCLNILLWACFQQLLFNLSCVMEYGFSL
ncbi:hypothetical protein K469DRAFT_690031 [Zopfia rhizophila CBS 207.26]|uniref:GPI ethanolamine phosphate transferase 2 n=1 Tax=Zopfia rhizophila CBS 207.26 TaxID=1314779 RepID=A0A6A6DZ70_9PEZI|nr:hypothetical protein K469DRAFT_690031 [Zopfia rhizophila CBS 207.26]